MRSLVHHTSFVLLALLSAFCGAARADTIVQPFNGPFSAVVSGTLPTQGTVLLEQFDLPAVNALTVTSTSYATGGFQSNLVLFDSAGNFVTASVPFGSADPQTGLIGDTTFSQNNLAAGMYTVALTDFLLNQSLTATNLSDGFTSNFGNGVTFVDANGNMRTGDYSLMVSISPAPEPEAAVLALLAFLPFVAFARCCSRRGRSGL